MNEDLNEKLREVFHREVVGTLRSLAEELDGFPKTAPEGRARAQAELFRHAHNLKTASRIVGAHEVEKISRELEDLFAEVKQGTVELTASLVERCLAATEGIVQARAAFEEGQTLGEMVDSLVVALREELPKS